MLSLAIGLTISIFLFDSASAQSATYKEDQIQALYDYHEEKCVEKGWQKKFVNINGVERKILWKGPKNKWQNGVIITLHGGGGTYSNYCSNLPIGKPMVDFGDLALKEGFAVFSLDSGRDLMLDENKVPCGKRWDCLAQDQRSNRDLDFIEKVITEIIPELRPDNSSEDIFMTGISNGGFMTILASTHFNDKVRAFAPVSAGDPYGIYIDCSDKSTGRKNAPGRWYDKDTNIEMGKTDSCVYSYEKQFAELMTKNKLPFKQFHHEGDSAVDISCMRRVQNLLVQNGYKDKGSYIIKNVGQKRLWKHFWLSRYNYPLIEFFKNYAKKKSINHLTTQSNGR